jgi:putative redox protein
MGTIRTEYKGDMLFESRVNGHRVVIDVPASMGGKGRGPTPPDLFVASLGSCVAAFVANYCNNTGIDTTGMTVDVSFEKAEDPTRLTDMRVEVNLPRGDLKGRENAILRVAERCPVHETVCTLEDVEILLQSKAGAG